MKPRLFVELCARLGSVSLQLQGGRRCKPPLSTPGAKVGYASVILAAAGLHPGQGADGYLWCEPEAGPRSVLATYPRPDALAEVAATIRGWIGEPPKDLWLRLREEERAAPGTCPARWMLLSKWSFSGKGWEHGYGGPGSVVVTNPDSWTTAQRDEALERPRAARLIEEMVRTDWPPVVIAEDARAVEPPDDVEGVVVYFDPPYAGKTGYQHNLPRADVVTIARRWADAGALVIVSEAEPIAELGWECMDISTGRRGNARTYGATAEWLTMSRAPVHRVAVQGSLWGAA